MSGGRRKAAAGPGPGGEDARGASRAAGWVARLSPAALARLRRLGPDGPDEMGRELAEGPDAVAATLLRAGDAGARRDVLLGPAERLILLGTGASLAVARSAAPVWRASWPSAAQRPAVLVRESAEAVFDAADGECFRPGDLVFAISQSGVSPETLAAARLADAAGARVVAVTAHEASPLAKLAAGAVVTPIGEERGAATKSELATLAALLALADALPMAAAEIEALRTWLSAIADAWVGLAAPVGCLTAARRLWIAGLGSTAGLAHAGSLLWHEKVHRQAVGVTISEFRHGPIEAAGPRDAVVVLVPPDGSPGLAAYLRLLDDELAQLGTPSVWLGALAPSRHALALTVPLPPPPTLSGLSSGTAASLLGATLRLQQLARGTAHAAGTYADGFRVLRRIVRAAPLEFD